MSDSKFYQVSDPSVLISILKERHPFSCMVQNQVAFSEAFQNEIIFYTIGKQVNSNTWIIANNIREDYGSNYSISVPITILQGKEEIPENIKECFLSGGLINWDNLQDNMIYFTWMPKSVSNMLIDIAANEKGHVLHIHPCNLYYMEIAEALKLEICNDNPTVVVKRLSKNDADFISKTWEYSLPETKIAVQKCLERSASGGVFVNANCVCGIYSSGFGFQTALYTLKDYRKKGYAKFVEKFTFKEYAKDGGYPCVTVETQNKRSQMFHEGLGLKLVANGNEIFIEKLNID